MPCTSPARTHSVAGTMAGGGTTVPRADEALAVRAGTALMAHAAPSAAIAARPAARGGAVPHPGCGVKPGQGHRGVALLRCHIGLIVQHQHTWGKAEIVGVAPKWEGGLWGEVPT